MTNPEYLGLRCAICERPSDACVAYGRSLADLPEIGGAL